MHVAVLGASARPDRYSYRAVMLLEAQGHVTYPVHPGLRDLEGRRVYRNLLELPGPVHTVTVYVGAARSGAMASEMTGCGARRFIFNPGAENPELEAVLDRHGHEVLDACTLVLLKTGQF